MSEKNVEKKKKLEVVEDFKSFKTSWENAFHDEAFIHYFRDEILPRYIYSQRWFAGKASNIKYISMASIQPMQMGENLGFALVLEVYFREAFTHSYFMPITKIDIEDEISDKAVITKVNFENESVKIIDALYLESFRKAVFHQIQQNKVMQTENGNLVFQRGSFFPEDEEYESSRLLSGEQSNTTFFINNKYVLKVYRRLFDRANPDYEISYYLTEKANFNNSPKFAGSVNWERSKDYIISIGLMQELIPNNGDAWEYFLPYMKKFFEACFERQTKVEWLPKWELFRPIAKEAVPRELYDLFRLDIVDKIDLLGQRTAEMHVRLGQEKQDLAFTPSYYNGDFSVWLKNRLFINLRIV